MAKERKSKHQKLLSDKRHSQKSSPQTSEVFYSLSSDDNPKQKKPVISASSPKISTTEYAYLNHDLKKFAIITGSILAIELGIYWTSVGF